MTHDERAIEILRADVAAYRGIARAALDVAADLQQQLDAKDAVLRMLKREIRVRSGLPVDMAVFWDSETNARES